MKYQPGLISRGGSSALLDVVASALIDALPFARRLRTPLIVLAILYVIGLALSAAFPPSAGTPTSTSTDSIQISYSTSGGSVAVGILSFFVLAEAVRTILPEFRMTVGRFFSLIGWALLVGLCIGAGFIALIVPGVWLLGRLMPATYIVLLRPSANPLKTAWHATKGRFWQTLGLMLLVGFAGGVIGSTAAAFNAVAGIWAPLALLVGPVAFALQAFATIFATLAYVRWTNELLLASGDDGQKALTSTQAAGIVP